MKKKIWKCCKGEKCYAYKWCMEMKEDNKIKEKEKNHG